MASDPQDPLLDALGLGRTPMGSIFDPERGEVVEPAKALEQDVTTAGEDVAAFTSQFSEGLGRSGTSALIGLSQLAGADDAADYWREKQDVMGRAYGGEGTGAGTAGRLIGRIGGEVAQFAAPGRAVASGAARLASKADDASKLGRVLSRIARPSTRMGRVAREATTGGPGQAAIAAAGPEESMLGLGAELTDSETLRRAAENPYARAVAEVGVDVATMGAMEGVGAVGRGIRRTVSPLDDLSLEGVGREAAAQAGPTRAAADRTRRYAAEDLREAERAAGGLTRTQRERMGRLGGRETAREAEAGAETVEQVREAAESTRRTRPPGTPPPRREGQLRSQAEIGEDLVREMDRLPSAREAGLERAGRLTGEAGIARREALQALAGAGAGAAGGGALAGPEGAAGGALLGMGATRPGRAMLREGASRLRGLGEGGFARVSGEGPNLRKAIRLEDGTVHTAEPGEIHVDILRRVKQQKGRPLGAYEAGWANESDDFLREHEALQLLGPEAGGIRHGLASSLAGGVGGAATGAALSDEPTSGALLGAGIGMGVTEGGRRAMRRLLRGEADEAAQVGQNLVQETQGREAAQRAGKLRGPEPEVQKVDAPDGEEGGLFAVAVQKGRELKGKVEDFGRRYFTVSGDLPDDVFQRKVASDNRVQRELQETRLANRDLDRALRAAGVKGGYSGLDEAGQRQLDDALKGRVSLEELPAEVRPVVKRMRDHIDRLSRRMIDEGMVEGELAATVEENLGTYAHRSYRAFDDPEWAEKVDPEVRNKAKAWFRDEIKARNPDLGEGELEDKARAYMESYLYDKSESPLQFFAKGKIGSKDLSVLQRRKDVPEEIRALLGEYTDPRVNYVRSVAKMSRLMESQAFLDDVREAGLGRFLHTEPTGDHVARIAADESEVMSPLNGLYATPEIKDAFEQTFTGGGIQGEGLGAMLGRGYMRLLGAAKFSKTIGSAMTHVRNFVSNPMFLVANGNNPLSPAKWMRAGRTAATNVGPAERVTQKLGADAETSREYFLRLQELGVVNQDARASELRDVVNDAMRQEDNLPLEFQRGKLAQTTSAMTRTYQAEDDFWKTVFFESEMDKLRRALPDAADEEIQERAAELTQRLMPNYSQVPEGVKLLRRSPLVGAFVSFWAESLRVTKNAMRQAATELASDNPALRRIGARRVAGLLAAGTAVGGATAASRWENDISADEDRDIRRFLPPWSRNSNIVYLGTDDEGNQQWIDLSYTDPHSVWRKPVVAMLVGEDWEEKLSEATREALGPFLGEELVTEKALDIARNRTRTGGEVYNEAAPLWRQFAEGAAHAAEVFEPGTITSARRVLKGLRGETSDWGKEYDPAIEAAAVATGIRLQELDVKQSLSFNIPERRGSVRDAQRMLTSVATNRGEVGEDELRSAYEQMEAARRDAWLEAHRDAQAAMRLGVPEEEVYRLIDQSFSRRDAHDIIRGIYRPYRPSDRLFQSVMESVRSTGGREDVEQMAARVAERRRIIAEEARKREPVMLTEDGETVPLGRRSEAEEEQADDPILEALDLEPEAAGTRQ